MTPTHDVVQKLLVALKDSHQKHMDAIGIDLRDSSVCQLIAQTEAQLAGESATPSPANACIRAAKKVIAALNLPEGAGICWHPQIGGFWAILPSKPEVPKNYVSWPLYGEYWILPPTAIPPWPGDFRESWITALTEEVTE